MHGLQGFRHELVIAVRVGEDAGQLAVQLAEIAVDSLQIGDNAIDCPADIVARIGDAAGNILHQLRRKAQRIGNIPHQRAGGIHQPLGGIGQIYQGIEGGAAAIQLFPKFFNGIAQVLQGGLHVHAAGLQHGDDLRRHRHQALQEGGIHLLLHRGPGLCGYFGRYGVFLAVFIVHQLGMLKLQAEKADNVF